jgi:hypothetical protein
MGRLTDIAVRALNSAHARSLASADLKLLAQHHQHRVTDAHGGHAGKTGQAQQAQVALLKMV